MYWGALPPRSLYGASLTINTGKTCWWKSTDGRGVQLPSKLTDISTGTLRKVALINKQTIYIVPKSTNVLGHITTPKPVRGQFNNEHWLVKKHRWKRCTTDQKADRHLHWNLAESDAWQQHSSAHQATVLSNPSTVPISHCHWAPTTTSLPASSTQHSTQYQVNSITSAFYE